MLNVRLPLSKQINTGQFPRKGNLYPMGHVEVSDKACRSPIVLRSGMSVSDGCLIRHVELPSMDLRQFSDKNNISVNSFRICLPKEPRSRLGTGTRNNGNKQRFLFAGTICFRIFHIFFYFLFFFLLFSLRRRRRK